MIQKYLWNGGHSKIQLSKLQIFKENGGLSVPDFKLYFMSYQLRAIQTWLNPHSLAPWRDIEAELVKPYRLQDILFSGLFLRKYALNFGNIITSTISNFRGTEEKIKYSNKWHIHTPIWRNYNIKSGSRPFISEQWTQKGINNFADIFNEGLLSFENMRRYFDLPGSSFTLDSVQP